MKLTKRIIPFLFIVLLLPIVSTGCTNYASAKVPAGNMPEKDSDDKTLSPYFVVLSEHPESDQLPLKETSASVNIVGVIADVTVKQMYVNTGKNTLEAIYTFPLSTRAAVYGMKMKIGKRTIIAKISEKEKAKQDYEKAKSDGKRVSLLEQNRPNVFTMNVANIAVKDTIIVEVKYTELLVPENGEYSFVYPTVVGPRYSNKQKSESGSTDDFVSTPYTKEGELPTYKFDLEIKINAGIPIQDITCATHKLNVVHPNMYSALLKLDPTEQKGGNRDVIVNYSLQGNKIESGVMLYENGDENFFLMMVQPPKKVLEDEIPPREYIFIVDVSGSMNGFPLDISKKLLRNLILNLKPTDKFNVVLFAGSTGLFSDASVNATQENLDKAVQYIDKEKGGGGTQLLDALKCAYALPRSYSKNSRSFVLVSDGYVDVEKEAFDMIREHNDKGNFFCFGIGSGVNLYLMEGLAFMGNGEPMIVDRPENAQKQAEKFRSYINSPLLSQIKVNFGSMDVCETEPSTIPDMMAERPIIIFGKYKVKADGLVTLSGQTGNSQYSKTLDFSKVKPNPSFSAIRYLWARERIKLLDYYNTTRSYFRGENSDLIKKEITDLGLKYNLMTAYTSFIAIDEKTIVDKNGKIVTVKQPLPFPQNVSGLAVGDVSEECDVVRFSSGSAPVVEEEDNVVFQVVETMPEFVGGNAALLKYLSDNIIYPEKAKKAGIQGKVILQFDVEKDGSVVNVVVVRSVSPELDAEAIRLVKNMPKWKPGKQRGMPVRVRYTLPISFKLT